VKLLQVGVRNVGVLEVWKEYLPQGSIIHGVDKSVGDGQLDNLIFLHSGSASDIDFMEVALGDIQFDVVVDGGLRYCEEVILVFEYLFPRLTAGGCYVVEDMDASYVEKYGGGLRADGSSVEYFKRMVDFGLNRRYIEGAGVYEAQGCNPEIVKGICGISFFDSLVSVDRV
jgi:hypothetical protein